MYKVTIAIPVYNTQDFIKESLLSALNQTLKEIEFLIIDDGGNDKSMDIVRDLIKIHSRGKDIRIITHEKNLGLANARNTALREATGEYFYFLDSDDTIKEDCIKFLYNKAQKYLVDFVAASHQEIDENEQLIKSYIYPDLEIKGNGKIAEYCYKEFKNESIIVNVWNKLYKLSFLRDNKIACIPNRSYEDAIFTFNLILRANSCILSSKVLYNYKIRANSIMQYNPRKIIPIKEIEDHLFINRYKKKESYKYKEYSFYEYMITQIMVSCIKNTFVIIDKNRIISEKISPETIKKILASPATFNEICKFRHYKITNILFFLFSKLPYTVEVVLIKIYNHYRKSKNI